MCSTEPAAALTAGSIFAAAGTSRKDERSLRVNAYALVCCAQAAVPGPIIHHHSFPPCRVPTSSSVTVLVYSQ